MRKSDPAPGNQAENQADNLTALVEWINSQGDAGEVKEIMDKATRQEGERSPPSSR
ncbi:hypothetical protein [Paenibacillus antri]|uniref:hypothetical protein n=1 Tax=Paenibacillus antri TaxID=2582848 RepID=UPI0013051EF8|nr:hypothetical protein [Paenibacillus antri]